MAVGTQNQIYVGDRNGLIRELDASGALVRNIASLPHRVSALAVDETGSLYASSFWFDGTLWRGGVWRIETSGAVAWSATTHVGGTLAVADGRVWVGGVMSDTGSAKVVYGLDLLDGTPAGQITIEGPNVQDLAVLPNGNLIVAYDWNATEFQTDGTAVRSLNDFGHQIAIGPGGDMYGTAGRLPNGQASPVSWQLHRRSAAGELLGSYTSGEAGFAVDLAVSQNGVVWASGHGGNVLSRIDPSTPDAAVVVSESPVDSGASVQFDASSSTAAFSQVTGYEWDLNGDGSYERSTGLSPVTTTSFANPGVHQVGVRVTATGGGHSDAQVAVDVRLTSPPGPLGVSIDEGAQYTNDPNVHITARWPHFATSMLISNDGGFGNFKRVPVSSRTPWKLQSSGPERLPKTIYVRFEGGSSGTETYQDDIILDETKPQVAAAKGALISGRGSESKRLVALTIKAIDKTSGVKSMQVATDNTKRNKWVKFKAKSQVRLIGTRVFIRVRDRAGNVSKWYEVTISRRMS